MLELGGNIKLEGFNSLEPAKLVVVKKIVGNHVKKIDSDVSKVNLLHLTLHDTGGLLTISGKIDVSGNIKEDKDEDANLFFALNKVLSKLG